MDRQARDSQAHYPGVITFERLSEGAKVPEHHGDNAHDNVGMDFFASAPAEFSMVASGIWTATVPTGLRVSLPKGWHIRMASRSGLAFKKDTFAFPGTIDSSYRGEIMVKMVCFSDHRPDAIKQGDKIAQGIVFRSLDYTIVEGEVSTDTERGDKGFGSSGM